MGWASSTGAIMTDRGWNDHSDHGGEVLRPSERPRWGEDDVRCGPAANGLRHRAFRLTAGRGSLCLEHAIVALGFIYPNAYSRHEIASPEYCAGRVGTLPTFMGSGVAMMRSYRAAIGMIVGLVCLAVLAVLLLMRTGGKGEAREPKESGPPASAATSSVNQVRQVAAALRKLVTWKISATTTLPSDETSSEPVTP